MGSGRRCGCWAISDLELERSKHQVTLEENVRKERKIVDLQDELEILHGTLADLEKRYADLSSRHRKSLTNLDEAANSTDRLKDYSNEMSTENRRLKSTCERLQDEVTDLRDEITAAKEEAEEERRRRLAIESTLGRDLEETERSYHAELRRATSLHDMDSQHLKQDITRLQNALAREKQLHSVTKRNLHHASMHISHRSCPPYNSIEWPYFYVP